MTKESNRVGKKRAATNEVQPDRKREKVDVVGPVDESQGEPGGNTETPGSKRRKQPVQFFCWFFTLAQEHESQKIQEKELWDVLNENCKKFEFQLESGESTGYVHYQGWFSLKVKERNFIQIKNQLGLNWIHLEPLKNIFASHNYCTKSKTYLKGPWSHAKKPLKPLIEVYRPWQQSLYDEIMSDNCDNRKVIWYFDEIGNKGKSTFAVHLHRQNVGVYRFPGKFKRADVAHVLSTKSDVKVILFDIEKDDFYGFDYSILGELKTGQLFCSKYESHIIDFDSPWVVVFANNMPDEKRLSQDRWTIRTL